jgi:hypothetical protein
LILISGGESQLPDIHLKFKVKTRRAGFLPARRAAVKPLKLEE